MPDLLLGLIGDNIARSKAPLLHHLAGRLCGLDVPYERLVPRELGADFDAVFRHAATGGVGGINVTCLYKEPAAARVTAEDPLVRAIGAVNTVVFPDGRKGYNTDCSGFVAAYRGARGETPPGAVCMIGGVGKAVAFGLIALGADELRIAERDLRRAEALAAALAEAWPSMRVRVTENAAEAARGAAGLINCTPVRMVGHDGTPLPRAGMAGAGWAFDAVYAPVRTQFLQDAAAEGLAVISGYELFFHQGVDAWALFSGRPVDPAAPRAALAEETAAILCGCPSPPSRRAGSCATSCRLSRRRGSRGVEPFETDVVASERSPEEIAALGRRPRPRDRRAPAAARSQGHARRAPRASAGPGPAGRAGRAAGHGAAPRLLVERDGYTGFGAPNAPIRLAAQARLSRHPAVPRS